MSDTQAEPRPPTVEHVQQPRPPKWTYLKICIPTTNVNHTALYKHAEKLGGSSFRTESFRRQFYSKPSPYGKKDTTSREHDEVIVRALEVMGLKKQFVSLRGTRYVIIYDNYKTADQDSIDALREELNDFVKHFQRKPQKVEIIEFHKPDQITKIS